jgi:release factor glutamine methyltransferase
MWRAGRDRLADAGFGTPELDAQLLAEQALGLTRLDLTLREREPVSEDAAARFAEALERRLAGEPVARILGHKGFYGLDFALGPETLVPRPETELLVDLALTAVRGRDEARLLDLGTGTGCIAISVLANAADATAVATDLSDEALAVARGNAERIGVGARLELRRGAWFAALETGETFDVIVSNPPYIAHDDIAGLEIEVRGHDPLLALDGGPDGLDPYRIIVAEAPAHLRPGGLLAVEIGADQGEAVSALFARAGFARIEVFRDLAGHDRVVRGQRDAAGK